MLDGRELQEFLEQIMISHEEETRLGIPDDRRGLHDMILVVMVMVWW